MAALALFVRSSLLDVEDKDPEEELRPCTELAPTLEEIRWKAAGAETTSRRKGDCALREVNRSSLVDMRGLVGAERLAADEVIEE